MQHTEHVAAFEDVPLPGVITDDRPDRDALSVARSAYAARLDALDSLGWSAQSFAQAGEALIEAVHGARSAGLSWAAIGDVLDLDRETARRRFGSVRVVPGAPE